MRFLLGLLNFRIVLKRLTLKFTRNLEKTFKTEVLWAYFSSVFWRLCNKHFFDARKHILHCVHITKAYRHISVGGFRLGKYVFIFLGDPRRMKDSISFQHTHIPPVMTIFWDSGSMDIPCRLFYKNNGSSRSQQFHKSQWFNIIFPCPLHILIKSPKIIDGLQIKF